jgi:beta-1,4-mannosyl-glycoprotein beta-1,4-N-acetylglucosaminyltransferase
MMTSRPVLLAAAAYLLRMTFASVSGSDGSGGGGGVPVPPRQRHIALASAVPADEDSEVALWKLSVLLKSVQVQEAAARAAGSSAASTTAYHVCRVGDGFPHTEPAHAAATALAHALSTDIGAPVRVVNVQRASRYHRTNPNTTSTATASHPSARQRYDNFLCTTHVANLLYHAGDYDAMVLYIGTNLVVTSPHLLPALWDTHVNVPDGSYVLCAPRLNVRLMDIELLPGAVCEMDLLATSPAAGHRLHSVANATALGVAPTEVDHVLALGAGRAYRALLFTDDARTPLLRAGQYWHQNLVHEVVPYLVEFEGYQHRLLRVPREGSDCHLTVHVEWPFFSSITPVGFGLGFIFVDPDVERSFAGCGPLPIAYHTPAPTLTSTPTPTLAPATATEAGPPIRVIDGILFFDEVSMLRLRLAALKDVVDHHIIVEANHTFTGKPKPLYFLENRHLFAEYASRITHVVVPNLAQPVPGEANHVWENEYHSRDMVTLGLAAIDAHDDDIVLVADTDEIPHPDAVLNLRAKARHARHLRRTHGDAPPAPQIYKIFVDNYLYHFDCYIDQPYAKGTPLTGATIGDMKRIVGEYLESIPVERYLSASRLYWQHEGPLRFENVIAPGGWHLSFFENIDRIKRKIESYGHQNFVKQFADGANITAAVLAGAGVVGQDGKVDAYISKELPAGVEMSVSAISQRVAAGAPIDYRQVGDVSCRAGRWALDPLTARLRALWDEVATAEDRV